jgi:hypothetical protein
MSALLPPSSVPTLTEVVDGWAPAPALEGQIPVLHDVESLPVLSDAIQPDELAVPEPAGIDPLAGVPGSVQPDMHALTDRVLNAVQGSVDRLLLERLEPAMTEALQGATAAMVASLRQDLPSILREVVSQELSREMSRLGLTEDSAPVD